MLPAQPPLPTASNLPFQLVAGSQTSILMSESGDGVRVAVTRQKAGRVVKGLGPRPGAGGVKAPAATVWAAVMVVVGSLRLVSVVQSTARRGSAVRRVTKSFTDGYGIEVCVTDA